MVFFRQDIQITEIAQQILEEIFQEFPNLARDQIALTWLVYDHPVIVNTGGALSPEEFWQHEIRGFSYRGFERIYPASIVKLFYLVAIEEWLEKGMIPDSLELQRAICDSIIDSSNDATSLILDTLTGTTSGPELPPNPFETWKQQRNIVNRYFKSLGWSELDAINVNQKPWNEGPYGREKAFLGEMMENRNMLTTDSIARLLHSIIGGVAVSSDRSSQMMKLLKRNLNPQDLAKYEEDENQVTGFLGGALPANAQIWSKAGWTSQVRHDAAYIEIPQQQPYLLVVFTKGKDSAKNHRILPFISQIFIKGMKSIN